MYVCLYVCTCISAKMSFQLQNVFGQTRETNIHLAYIIHTDIHAYIHTYTHILQDVLSLLLPPLWEQFAWTTSSDFM